VPGIHALFASVQGSGSGLNEDGKSESSGPVIKSKRIFACAGYRYNREQKAN